MCTFMEGSLWTASQAGGPRLQLLGLGWWSIRLPGRGGRGGRGRIRELRERQRRTKGEDHQPLASLSGHRSPRARGKETRKSKILHPGPEAAGPALSVLPKNGTRAGDFSFNREMRGGGGPPLAKGIRRFVKRQTALGTCRTKDPSRKRRRGGDRERERVSPHLGIEPEATQRPPLPPPPPRLPRSGVKLTRAGNRQRREEGGEKSYNVSTFQKGAGLAAPSPFILYSLLLAASPAAANPGSPNAETWALWANGGRPAAPPRGRKDRILRLSPTPQKNNGRGFSVPGRRLLSAHAHWQRQPPYFLLLRLPRFLKGHS